MMESFGNWNFAYNYIDEKATPEQRKALEAIAAKVLTPGASKKTETRYVPINRKIEGTDHEITLGQYGTFRGHLVQGGMGGAPKIANPPGGRSGSSRIFAGPHVKDDVHRCGPELGLGKRELYVWDVHDR